MKKKEPRQQSDFGCELTTKRVDPKFPRSFERQRQQTALERPEYPDTSFMIPITFVVALLALTITSGSLFSSSKAKSFEPQTTQKPRPTDVRELKAGAPIERELAGGEGHSYSIAVTVGQYVHVVVEQKGIDVVVTLFGPDGKKLSEVDDDPAVGSESIFVVAKVSGDYRWEIQSSNKDAKPGRYEIKIETSREATSDDQIRVAAEETLEEGNQLRDKQTAESQREALKKYESALPLWRAVEDQRAQAYTLNRMGFIWSGLSEPKKALEYYDQALPLWRAVGDRLNEATTLTNIGMAYWRLGDSQKALEYHHQALPLKHAVGDLEGEASTLNNIGTALATLSQREAALKAYTQALPLAQAVGNRHLQTVMLNNIGVINLQLGELQKALEYLTQVLPLKRALGDRRGEATTLHNLGRVYDGLGESSKALEYFNQSILLKQAVGDRQNEAVSLQSLSVVYQRMGDLQRALNYSSKALALSRAVGDRRMEAYELNDMGKIYRRLGDGQQALAHFNDSLSLAQTVGDRQVESYIRNNIGDMYLSSGDPRKALECFSKSLQLSHDTGARLDEAASLFGVARSQSRLGELSQARTQILAAIEIIESTRSKVVSQEFRSSFLASNQDFYELYIDLLMQLHKGQPGAGHDSAALQASERVRARSLLEILTEARADIRQGVDPVLLGRERSLQQQLSAKSERFTRLLSAKHTEEQETVARKEVEALLTDYQDVEAQIRAKSPRYAALTQPQQLSLKEIQQVLDEDTVLLEYALGEERSYLWAVTQTSIKSFELPKRAEIETAARRVYEVLTARNKSVRFEKQEDKRARIAQTDAEYSTVSTQLSEMILGPAAVQLRKKRLLIVSEGALQYVPFGALSVPSGQAHAIGQQGSARNKRASFLPLIIGHEIVNLPSASVLATLRKELLGRQRSAKTVAVLADPVFQGDDPRVKRYPAKTVKELEAPTSKSTETRGLETEMERSAKDTGELEFRRLPFSRQEAEGIAALTPNTMRKEALDFEANRATATSDDLSNYRIIHFATHGLLDSQHPELSGIVLSLVDKEGKPQDGFLRLNEIYNLKLRADLVVLSACRTALGKEIKGEGLVGLTRGFMYAGAPRVVASLWAVDDAVTAELMKRFYREMLIKGQRPAAALRAAQVSIWKERRFPPYYWAAFVLQGEWN